MKDDRSLNPRVFWPLALIGVAIIGFGVYGLLENSDRTHPHQWARWFFGSAIAHDFVLAPVVAGVGILVARHVPARHRAVVQGALISSGIVLLFAYPFVRGFGRRPDDPSTLPNNYAAGLLWILGLIWMVAGCLALRNHRRRRSKTSDR
jgi:hypothetical protein